MIILCCFYIRKETKDLAVEYNATVASNYATRQPTYAKSAATNATTTPTVCPCSCTSKYYQYYTCRTVGVYEKRELALSSAFPSQIIPRVTIVVYTNLLLQITRLPERFFLLARAY